MTVRLIGTLTLAAAAIGCWPATTHAEEGGSGHYMPGTMASFIDAAPTEPGFMVRLDVLNYGGDVKVDQALPVAGLSTLDLDAESWGLALTAVWTPDLQISEQITYSAIATVPYVFMEVSGDLVTGNGSQVISREDDVDGFGDIVLMPLVLNYNTSPDLNMHFRVAVIPPTGKYQTGRLANTGKNYWTYEPTVGFSYFGQQNGIEAQLYLGMDFNGRNDATDYKTGTQFHAEGTLAQHIPAVNGIIGGGVTGFYYKQISGDSGTGAIFGGFKAKSVGLGPTVSYIADLGNADLAAEFKWVIEVDTKRRLKGDTMFLKVLLAY